MNFPLPFNARKFFFNYENLTFKRVEILFEIHWHKLKDEIDFFFLDQNRDQIDNVRVFQFF